MSLNGIEELPVMSVLLRLAGVSVSFQSPRGVTDVLKGIDLTIADGEAVALLGASGSGKTTLAKTVAGLLPASARVAGFASLSGRELYGKDGYPTGLRGETVTYLMQESPNALNPFLTIGSQVAEVIRVHRGTGRREASQAALEELANVGLAEPRECARCYAHELSGGTRQRVLVALALACHSRLLIADEFTAGLDEHGEKVLTALVKERVLGEGRSLLLITHDTGLAESLCGRQVSLTGGSLEERRLCDA